MLKNLNLSAKFELASQVRPILTQDCPFLPIPPTHVEGMEGHCRKKSWWMARLHWGAGYIFSKKRPGQKYFQKIFLSIHFTGPSSLYNLFWSHLYSVCFAGLGNTPLPGNFRQIQGECRPPFRKMVWVRIVPKTSG